MKKRLLLSLGVLCSFGFYSCQKNTAGYRHQVEPNEIAAKAKHGNPSNFFDPLGLISASQHGKLDTIQKGFGFTEGPAVDKRGDVFFTDQPNDKIYRWDASNGRITLFLQRTGRSNGTAFNKDGDLITCADMHGEIWKIRPNGHHEVLINNYNGKLLNGPNDVWINPVNGGMYFTDPIFPRDYWDAGDPRQQAWPPTHSEQAASGKGGYIYYLAPHSHQLVRVTTEAMGWNSDIWPNGVVGTPDGRKLYVNEWTGDATGTIWVFDIRPNGALGNQRVFVDNLTGCDGMSMDDRGNIYVSNAAGITAFDKHGNKVLEVPVGNGSASNNVFGGHDNKLLFITGTVDRVTSLKMKVKGVERF